MGTRRALVALAMGLWLSGCAHYTLINPGNVKVAGCCSLETPIAWSRSEEGRMEVWTVDGPALEAIYFFKGIADGETLFRAPSEKVKLPKFRKTMVESEIVEFVVDSLETAGQIGYYVSSLVGTNVQAVGLRPFKIGSDFGFRFELAYLSGNGLEYEALVAGIVENEKLFLVAYAGTRQYYFPKYKSQAEQVMGSLKIE
jgi:hypothetical protein